MKQEITKTNGNAEHRFGLSNILERVVVAGDLSRLSPEDRLLYYRQVCESLGLNPLTRPFDYIVLNGKLTLYARKDATDQLRRIHGISVRIVAREMVEPLGLYVVTARATAPDGREDESIGVVSVKGFSGDALANALMKAETKAKRRATLSLVGLGWTDESEVESVPGATAIRVDHETGEILDSLPPAELPGGSGTKPPTEKQFRLLGVLLNRVGLAREDASRYISALLGREVQSAREILREEVPTVIDHLQALAQWMDELGVEDGLRREIMQNAAQHGDAFTDRETLETVIEGHRAEK